MRSSLIAAPIVLGSVVLAAGLTEAALRLTHYVDKGSVQSFTEYDPLFGWRHKKNYSTVLVRPEYSTDLHYDANGIRGLDPLYPKPSGVKRIEVLGNTFIDGYSVPTQDRVTEVMGSLLGAPSEVVNLGVLAYSTDQELLLLRRDGWKYQPDLIIVGMNYADVWLNGQTDFLAQQKPAFAVGEGGELRLTNVPPPYRPSLRERFKLLDLIRNALQSTPITRKLAVGAGVFHGGPPEALPPLPAGAGGTPDEFTVYRKTQTQEVESGWSITQALLRQLKRETSQRGAQLAIFYLPPRIEMDTEGWHSAHLPPDYDPGIVAERLGEVCRAEGISYIEAASRFRKTPGDRLLYYPGADPNWNAAGHRLAGTILAEYVRNSWRNAR